MDAPDPPKPSRSKPVGIIVFVVIVGIAIALGLSSGPPPALEIAQGTTFDMEAGTVRHGEIVYRLNLAEEPTVYAGTVRGRSRAYAAYAPFVTTDLLITTGDYSDPEIVKVSWSNGHGRWVSKSPPQGSCTAIHILPRTPEVQAALDTVEEWSEVTITGYRETDGKIEGEDGSFRRVNNTNHHFVVATKVTFGVAKPESDEDGE